MSLTTLGTKRKHDFEPSWQDGKDWPSTVGFFPTDDPEARLYSAEIIGYLVGYADLSNTGALVLLGDPDASAYVLFSFSTPEEGPVPRSGPLLEDLGDDSGTCFTNPPLCINKQQLREGFAIIDRAPEIMDKAVES
jgi:hypothetical protein